MYGWMERWMHWLLLELLSQAGPQLLASAPSLLSQKKKKITHLPWAERGKEKEQAGRKASRSGIESEWERRERAKKKEKQGKGGGLKGFGAYLIRDIWWKTEKDLTSSSLPTTISLLKQKFLARTIKQDRRGVGAWRWPAKTSHLCLWMTSLQLCSSKHLYLALPDKRVSSVPDCPSLFLIPLCTLSPLHRSNRPSLVTHHMLCCFPSHFISFSDHAVRLAGQDTLRQDGSAVREGWMDRNTPREKF